MFVALTTTSLAAAKAMLARGTRLPAQISLQDGGLPLAGRCVR